MSDLSAPVFNGTVYQCENVTVSWTVSAHIHTYLCPCLVQKLLGIPREEGEIVGKGLIVIFIVLVWRCPILQGGVFPVRVAACT